MRVGNGAWDQTQLDVYGELLSSLCVYRERLGELHPEIQAFVADLADTAARRWREKDSGIWEMRGEPLHHLSSKVMCWTALDRAVKLAPQLGDYAKEEEWAAERDRIREAILQRGWSEKRQAFAQSFDSDELDAAALLMPIYGFLPATDERMRSTIEAIARDLTEDGLVLRYRNVEGLNADGLSGEEGTFVICTFWLVSAWPRPARSSGRPALLRAARRLRERPRAAGRGDRHGQRRAARQLPAGVQSHRPDHRRLRGRQGPRSDRMSDPTTSSSSAADRPASTAPRALADGGLRVAIVERELVGGECDYWACIPSKTLLRPGEALQAAREAPGAAEAICRGLDVPAMLGWRDFMVADYDDAGQAAWLASKGITCCAGPGAWRGPGACGWATRRYGARTWCSPPARIR